MITYNNSKLLRAMAMLIVMVSHYATWMYVPVTNEALRYRISTWGPFGVDIFFMLSGYGLYISASKCKRMGLSFLIKRLIDVYIPYLFMVFVIMLINGEWKGISLSGVADYLTGVNYWYINVLLIFYIMFSLVWWIFTDDRIRIALILVGIAGLSFVFHRLGRNDFWVVSNMTFVIGIIAAFLEKEWKHGITKRTEGDSQHITRKRTQIITLVIVALAGGIGFAVTDICYWEIQRENPLGGFGCKCLMNVLFALLILGCAYMYSILTENRKVGKISGIFGIIGKYSLYIYVMHTVLFWTMLPWFIKLGFIAASVLVAVLSIVVSCLCGFVFNKYVCSKLERILIS